jgi:hypothetical protein
MHTEKRGLVTGVLIRAAIVSALGGLPFGFDTAVVAGATGSRKRLFALSDWQLGFVVSSALIGTISGSLAFAKPEDVWGRRAILKVLGALCSAAPPLREGAPAAHDAIARAAAARENWQRAHLYDWTIYRPVLFFREAPPAAYGRQCCEPYSTFSCPTSYHPSGCRPSIASLIAGFSVRGSRIPTRTRYVPGFKPSSTYTVPS